MATLSLDHQYLGQPEFAADGYHLQDASAARGRGVATNVALDIDGDPRRTRPDLGADEYWRQQTYLPIVSHP